MDVFFFFYMFTVGMEVDAALDSGSEGESPAGTILFVFQLSRVRIEDLPQCDG